MGILLDILDSIKEFIPLLLFVFYMLRRRARKIRRAQQSQQQHLRETATEQNNTSRDEPAYEHATATEATVATEESTQTANSGTGRMSFMRTDLLSGAQYLVAPDAQFAEEAVEDDVADEQLYEDYEEDYEEDEYFDEVDEVDEVEEVHPKPIGRAGHKREHPFSRIQRLPISAQAILWKEILDKPLSERHRH